VSLLLALTGGSGPAAFTLTASPAVVAITGQVVVLRVARRIAVSPATVPITGQSVALRSGRRITAGPATVPIAGQSITLTYAPTVGAFTLTASPATVAIAGKSVTLTYAPVSARGVMLPDPYPGAGEEFWIEQQRRMFAAANRAAAKDVEDAPEALTIAEPREDATSRAPEESDGDAIAAVETAVKTAISAIEAAFAEEQEEEMELLLILGLAA